MFVENLFFKQGLSFQENRIYKIFNILLILTILVVAAIAVSLIMIDAISSFWICIGEIVIFFSMLVLHSKGYFISVRYVFFVFAITTQVYGSLYHGENGGYDFLFFATALTPVLFFEKRGHYISLFLLSVVTYIAVKILYNHVTPVMPLERVIFPYYSNIFISGTLIFLGYWLFKTEHLKYEQTLKEQKDKIQNQKEALSEIKDQLEQLLEARARKIEEQNQSMEKYAYLNGHKVRSPLARILGLVNLTKYEDLDEEDKRRYYFKELKANARDLDNTLKEISQVLNSNMEP